MDEGKHIIKRKIFAQMTEETRRLVNKNNVILNTSRTDGKEKYSRQRFLTCNGGYDFLQHLFTARSYVQKKHKVDLQQVELLLALYPMRVFSQAEYIKLPRNYRQQKVGQLVKSGLVNILQDAKRINERLYVLSEKGKQVVRELYAVLSKEKPYSEMESINPMARPTANLHDKKKFELMKKINATPDDGKMKGLYK